jgi:hypothetical protein
MIQTARGAASLRHEVAQRCSADTTFALRLFHDLRRAIVRHDAMPALLQARDHVHAHLPESDKSEFHRSSSLVVAGVWYLGLRESQTVSRRPYTLEY